MFTGNFSRYSNISCSRSVSPDVAPIVAHRSATGDCGLSAVCVETSGVSGLLPWMVCGGAEIAKATSELMKQYDVAIWAFHGTFASGESFDTTFGLMHCVEKAADIYMRVQAAGGAKQTMQTQYFIDIAAPFGLTLPEKFLKD